MPKLPDYRSRNGVTFGLRWERAHTREGADYWLYDVIATKPNGADHAFRMFIRRDAYPTQAAADDFLLADPLTDVKGQLERVDDYGVPLRWPEPRDTWFVFP
jgi:hypothetical protein